MSSDRMANRKHAPRPADGSVVQSLASRTGARLQPHADRPQTPPGEMVQQSAVAARASDCFPQSFIRLVGHRHGTDRPFSWITARPDTSPAIVPDPTDGSKAPIG